MTEDDYWNSEHEDQDDALGIFLIDDPDDLTLVMLPKLDFNLDDMIEEYYKKLKKCRSKDQLKSILFRFYAHISGVVSLQNDINYLQDRAKELEFNIKMLEVDFSETE